MIQTLIVIVVIVVAVVFWLNRLFPAHARRIKTALGLHVPHAAGAPTPKEGKSCGGCSGCKGGGCH
ncbi:hypothetical protein [Asaia bogorensis]|uniref:hypothetical protein n=1 Tax=Asaia bogorensis TaxID=91915 RepID=UPI000EFB3311|nr:hypothetical protein [Asaia bogorensis]